MPFLKWFRCDVYVKAVKGYDRGMAENPNESHMISMLLSNIELQHADWDAVDNKTLGLISFSGVTMAIYLAFLVGIDPIRAWQVVCAIAVSLMFFACVAFAADLYAPRRFNFGLLAEDLWNDIDRQDALRAWAYSLYEGVEENKCFLTRKRRWLKWLLFMSMSQAALVVGSVLVEAVS